MTKAAGFEQYYDKMGGESCFVSQIGGMLIGLAAVSPNEAADRLATFAGGLEMSMSGKLWAPSELNYMTSLPNPFRLLLRSSVVSLSPDH